MTSPETKMARLPYCRDVTVGMSLPVCRHYCGEQPNAGKRCQFLWCNLDRITVGFTPLTPVGMKECGHV